MPMLMDVNTSVGLFPTLTSLGLDLDNRLTDHLPQYQHPYNASFSTSLGGHSLMLP